MDVGDHTTAGDGRLDEGVELLVTTDGELKVAGGDALDLLRFGVDVTRQRLHRTCLLYTSPSPRDATLSRMPSSA